MKILMIDDEKLPIQFTKDASESIKFDDNEVTVMRNYGDGLEALQADRWDILLLDWNLKEYTPERNGMKILRQLHVRKQYANKVGKIIIITSDEKYRLEMLEVCKAMLLDGKINAYESQSPCGRVL